MILIRQILYLHMRVGLTMPIQCHCIFIHFPVADSNSMNGNYKMKTEDWRVLANKDKIRIVATFSLLLFFSQSSISFDMTCSIWIVHFPIFMCVVYTVCCKYEFHGHGCKYKMTELKKYVYSWFMWATHGIYSGIESLFSVHIYLRVWVIEWFVIFYIILPLYMSEQTKQ